MLYYFLQAWWSTSKTPLISHVTGQVWRLIIGEREIVKTAKGDSYLGLRLYGSYADSAIEIWDRIIVSRQTKQMRGEPQQ